MKPILLAIAIMVSLIGARPAIAQAPNGQVSGSQLQEMCKDILKDTQKDQFQAGRCMGFVRAVLESEQVFVLLTSRNSNYEQIFYCAPRGVTEGQVLQVVAKFLNNHPERLQQWAVTLILHAMHDAFPCPVQTPSSK